MVDDRKGFADGRPRLRLAQRTAWTAPHVSERTFFAALGQAPYPSEGFDNLGDAFEAAIAAVSSVPAVIFWEGELQ